MRSNMTRHQRKYSIFTRTLNSKSSKTMCACTYDTLLGGGMTSIHSEMYNNK